MKNVPNWRYFFLTTGNEKTKQWVAHMWISSIWMSKLEQIINPCSEMPEIILGF